MKYRPPIRGVRSPIQRGQLVKPPQPDTRAALLDVFHIKQLISEIESLKKSHTNTVQERIAEIKQLFIKLESGIHVQLNTKVREVDGVLGHTKQSFAAALANLEATLARVLDIKKGEPGLKGDPGISPMIDVQEIARRAALLIPRPADGNPGKDGESIDLNQVIEAIFEQINKGKKKLSTKHIDGFEQTIAPLRSLAAGVRGGGDTVEAGTNITITTVNGKKRISTPGGTGIVYTETLTNSGDNQNFTALHSIATIFSLSTRNGQRITVQDTQGNTQYIVSGNTVTLASADANLASLGLEIVYA